jgi:hypothetical protein
MRIIIEAYKVLLDPDQRRRHDQWIREREADGNEETDGLEEDEVGEWDDAEQTNGAESSPNDDDPNWYDDDFDPTPIRRKSEPQVGDGTARALLLFVVAIAALGVLAIVIGGRPRVTSREVNGDSPSQEASSVARASELPTSGSTPLEWIRPAAAPNGRAWPARSGYVPGYPVLFGDGESTLTIDNRKGDIDAFLKLYAIGFKQPIQVRTILVRQGDQVTMKNLRPGQYEIRYQNLDSGGVRRSAPFNVKERKIREGMEVSEISITLYDVAGGKLVMTEIATEDF